MADAPKCPHCDGWGHEPDVFPLAPCGTCAGSGRAATQAPTFLSNAKQEELSANG